MMTRILDPMHRSISSRGISWEAILFGVECDMGDASLLLPPTTFVLSKVVKRHVRDLGRDPMDCSELTGPTPRLPPSRRVVEVYMVRGSSIVTDPTRTFRYRIAFLHCRPLLSLLPSDATSLPSQLIDTHRFAARNVVSAANIQRRRSTSVKHSHLEAHAQLLAWRHASGPSCRYWSPRHPRGP
jgi:hypothetical protein